MPEVPRAEFSTRNVVTGKEIILNSPFEEPKKHWDLTGAEPKIAEGRRPAGYVLDHSRKTRGTGRQSEAEAGTALAEREFVRLAVPQDLRERVRRWREDGYPGATGVTRALIEHWRNERRDRRLFFCQIEAAETAIFLVEVPSDRKVGLSIPRDADLERYCYKMATGTGKTAVMAMLIAWTVLNRANDRNNPRYTESILVVAPNITIRDQSQRRLPPSSEGNLYSEFDLVPASLKTDLNRARVRVLNWHRLARLEDPARGVVRMGDESDAAYCKRVLEELAHGPRVLVLNDEGHHCYRQRLVPEEEREEEEEEEVVEFEDVEEPREATVWIEGLDRLQREGRILRVCDFSATPYFLGSAGYRPGTPFPWIVSDFGLVDAIESGLVKIPKLPAADNSGGKDPRYRYLWRYLEEWAKTPASKITSEDVVRFLIEKDGALVTLADDWKKVAKQWGEGDRAIPPVMIVVCNRTETAEAVAKELAEGRPFEDFKNLPAEDGGNGTRRTLWIDTRAIRKAESGEGGAKEEELRKTVATIGKKDELGEQVRAVVSVSMLNEGWDAKNVTHILGLRAFGSQLLCEQVVGRGLRRMSLDLNAQGLPEPEYVEVFGIPFEVIPVQGGGSEPKAPRLTTVQNVPGRGDLVIRFPRVVGYMERVGEDLTFDFSGADPVVISAAFEPTEVRMAILGMEKFLTGEMFGRVSLVADTIVRDEFYKAHRLQTTLFDIAREITATMPVSDEPLRMLLFPQVLEAVETFVRTKVDLKEDADVREIALLRYRTKVVEQIRAAARPSRGKGTLVPVLQESAPVGETKITPFDSSKICFPTRKSSLSHVAADSDWEIEFAKFLEEQPRVRSYAKNYRFDFKIPYRHKGVGAAYYPDFIVVLEGSDGSLESVIVEIKGQEREEDIDKWAAARRWVAAVNADGSFGRWRFVVVRSPWEFSRILTPEAEPTEI